MFDISLVKCHTATKSGTADTNATPRRNSRLVEGLGSEPVIHLCTACLQDTQHAPVNGELNFRIRTQVSPQAGTCMIEFTFQHGCQDVQSLHRFKRLCRRNTAHQVIAACTELDIPCEFPEASGFHTCIGNNTGQRNAHLVNARFQFLLVDTVA